MMTNITCFRQGGGYGKMKIKIVIVFGLVLLLIGIPVVAINQNSDKMCQPQSTYLLDLGTIDSYWYTQGELLHHDVNVNILNSGRTIQLPIGSYDRLRGRVDYVIDAVDFYYEYPFHDFSMILKVTLQGEETTKYIHIDVNGGYYNGTLIVDVPLNSGTYEWTVEATMYDHEGSMGGDSGTGSSLFIFNNDKVINTLFQRFPENQPFLLLLLQHFLQKIGLYF